MVGSIEALVAAARPSGGGPALKLEPGTEVKVRVSAVLPNNVVRLTDGKASVEVRTSTPLPPGTELTLKVDGKPGQLQVQLVTEQGGKGNAPSVPTAVSGQTPKPPVQAGLQPVLTGNGGQAAQNVPARGLAQVLLSQPATAQVPGGGAAPASSQAGITPAAAAQPSAAGQSAAPSSPVPPSSASGQPLPAGSVSSTPNASTVQALHATGAGNATIVRNSPASPSPTAQMPLPGASAGGATAGSQATGQNLAQPTATGNAAVTGTGTPAPAGTTAALSTPTASAISGQPQGTSQPTGQGQAAGNAGVQTGVTQAAQATTPKTPAAQNIGQGATAPQPQGAGGPAVANGAGAPVTTPAATNLQAPTGAGTGGATSAQPLTAAQSAGGSSAVTTGTPAPTGPAGGTTAPVSTSAAAPQAPSAQIATPQAPAAQSPAPSAPQIQGIVAPAGSAGAAIPATGQAQGTAPANSATQTSAAISSPVAAPATGGVGPGAGTPQVSTPQAVAAQAASPVTSPAPSPAPGQTGTNPAAFAQPQSQSATQTSIQATPQAQIPTQPPARGSTPVYPVSSAAVTSVKTPAASPSTPANLPVTPALKNAAATVMPALEEQQASLAGVFAQLQALMPKMGTGQTPSTPQMRKVVEQLLGLRLNADTDMAGKDVQKALMSSGLFRESALKLTGKSSDQDMKSLLMGLRGLLKDLGVEARSPRPMTQPPVPSLRAAPKGQSPVNISPEEVGEEADAVLKRLMKEVDSALSRVRLGQMATRGLMPDEPLHTANRAMDLVVDLPVVIGGQTAVVQMQVGRDPENENESDADERAWRLFFGLELESTGAMEAAVSLRGGGTFVSLWVEREDMHRTLGENRTTLEAALAEAGLDLQELRFIRGIPVRTKLAAGARVDRQYE